jgi:putative restriction endonuclease
LLEPSDYLLLTPSAARSQWSAILGRHVPQSGRQVVFSPVETLLCLAASLIVDHSKYGASNRDRAEEPIPSLARLFKRPNSSVIAKMANLDGSRTHGARHEIEIASRLLSSPGELAALYRVILTAARDMGILAAQLPDFLGLEDSRDDLVLIGQDEITDTDVETDVAPRSARWADADHLDPAVTERLLVAAVRVGQHRFATGVLHNHGHQCVFCGLSVTDGGRRASRMLVASHIKAWKASTGKERLDVRNGLAACPSHDVAFDTGLITVNGGLRIHVKPHLIQRAASDDATRAVFGRPPLAERLLLPADAATPHESYLAWHHAQFSWNALDVRLSGAYRHGST